MATEFSVPPPSLEDTESLTIQLRRMLFRLLALMYFTLADGMLDSVASLLGLSLRD